ncbi:MAG: cytochrome c biogenesis protein CcsA, partial [Proteobacteria bacterium]|nr:cytochrome c biogenesis protein CcsA [Pseudomonadota bacterium]
MAHLGFYLCLLALISSCYGIVASSLSIKLAQLSWSISARHAMIVAWVSVVSAAGVLWFLLISRDYSLAYIYKNSSSDLPLFYTITAFWSSLEGSHFFWSLILSGVACVSVFTMPKELFTLRPYLEIFLSALMVWMYFLLVSYSDPFAVHLPKPSQGLGMNALLQNPYMAIHPPILFIGYTALVVPYAYSMAALCYGAISQGWLRVMRQWTLVAWVFLTVGIFLGGKWAYVELGWGGYWGWDPVENSSLVPWLLTTALIHGLTLQEKTAKLVPVNLALSILALFFSFFGTFLTRSGIVVSVHSFAESDIGKVYVVFLGMLFVLS